MEEVTPRFPTYFLSLLLLVVLWVFLSFFHNTTLIARRPLASYFVDFAWDRDPNDMDICFD